MHTLHYAIPLLTLKYLPPENQHPQPITASATSATSILH